MTPVGHSLAALSVAAVVTPRRWSPARKAGTVTAFVALALLPDAALPGWGHSAYLVSHSLFVALGVLAVPLALVLCRPTLRRRMGGWPVVLGGATCWVGHLLLDTTYNHGRGLRMFYPLSRDAALALPLPWLSRLHGLRADAHTARVLAVEVLFFGGLLIGSLWLRRRAARGVSG